MSKQDQSTHGVDMEAVLAPLTPEIIDQAREALSLAITLLLSPVGTNGRSGDKAFYGNSLMECRTEFTNNIGGQPFPTAGVSVTDKINFYINPHFLLSLTVNKQIELIIHEMEHILNLHPLRGKELMSQCVDEKQSDIHKLYNVCTDANINIPLTDLTENLGVTIERINEQLQQYGSKQRLDPADPSEVHFWKLRQFQEEMGDKLPKGFGEGEGGEIDDHSTWGESVENEEMAKAVVQSAMNRAADKTGIGNCPANVVRALEAMNKSLVKWEKVLEQFMVKTVKFSTERTRSRRNRRTGLVNPGSRKKPMVRLGWIQDESGSMCDEQVAQGQAEAIRIAALLGIEILYVPMDGDVGEVVKLKKGMKMNRTKCGGTYYQPPLDKAKELKVDGVIFAGDFDCADKPEKPKFPVLWLGINTKSPCPANFGKVIYIETKK